MILIKDMLDKIIIIFEYIDETYKEIKKEIPSQKSVMKISGRIRL